MHFDWATLWWRHLHAHGAMVRDQPFFRAFRARTGELQGIAPLMLTHRPGVGPIGVRQLQFIGADTNLTELRGIIAPAEVRVAAHCALLDHLRGCASEWDWALYSGRESEIQQPVDSRFATPHWHLEVPSYLLTLPASFDELLTRLPRNIKESLRKCRNSPKRDGITIEFEVVREPGAVPAAIEDFYRLHSARARSTDLPRHFDVFVESRSRRFFNDVCQAFAQRDALRIFQAKVSGRTVATRIAFVVSDSLYLYYSGYDLAFARYNIMTSVVAEAIRAAIGEGLSSVNLSTGRDVSKSRWRPTETLHRDVVLVSPSVRGELAYSASSHVRRLLEKLDPHWSPIRALTRRGPDNDLPDRS